MASAKRETDLLLRVRGTVQGVGFRPFVQRTASRLDLRGWVRNDAHGVLIRAAGPEQKVQALIRALEADAPPAAHVQSVAVTACTAQTPSGVGFVIAASDAGDSAVETAIPTDLALCADCRRELLDPKDRRHRYPFINCTQCGPRYSIAETLPYDRPTTTMRRFPMCVRCDREYHHAANRRFHAEPNACPDCGPSVALTDRNGAELAHGDEAIHQAATLLCDGRILAVKGIGGYHLLVDATNSAAVTELRRRKHRDEKPFAVMFTDVEAVRRCGEVSPAARKLLISPAAPIVLVPRRIDAPLAPNIAPGNPWIGAVIAYAPLHVLLLSSLPFPVVATSANVAEEPLCTINEQAHERLAGIADAFLDHDRPIAHPVDDSVVRLSSEGPILLRRARGHAPAPLLLPRAITGHLLCVGAQMKNTVAVAVDDRLVLSPHIGDLAGAATLVAFRSNIETLVTLHRSELTAVVHDKHPDYSSTRFATSTGRPTIAVQHHLAHVLACLLEHREQPNGVLGVSWDGTGYGEDGTIWGGEFILLDGGARRFARLRPFRLPGGEAAIRDPRRTALGLLHAAGDERFAEVAREFGFSDADSTTLRTMLARKLSSPVCSSIGRLFDGAGALLGLGRVNRFEGQTPLAVEIAARTAGAEGRALPLPVRDLAPGAGACCELDWQPLLERLLHKQTRGTAANTLAWALHAALAQAIVAVAQRAQVSKVALSGGCFQNALLLELTSTALRSAGFTVLTHRELPPNDGNIAAGQAAGALWGLTSVALP